MIATVDEVRQHPIAWVWCCFCYLDEDEITYDMCVEVMTDTDQKQDDYYYEKLEILENNLIM